MDAPYNTPETHTDAYQNYPGTDPLERKKAKAKAKKQKRRTLKRKTQREADKLAKHGGDLAGNDEDHHDKDDQLHESTQDTQHNLQRSHTTKKQHISTTALPIAPDDHRKDDETSSLADAPEEDQKSESKDGHEADADGHDNEQTFEVTPDERHGNYVLIGSCTTDENLTSATKSAIHEESYHEDENLSSFADVPQDDPTLKTSINVEICLDDDNTNSVAATSPQKTSSNNEYVLEEVMEEESDDVANIVEEQVKEDPSHGKEKPSHETEKPVQEKAKESMASPIGKHTLLLPLSLHIRSVIGFNLEGELFLSSLQQHDHDGGRPQDLIHMPLVWSLPSFLGDYKAEHDNNYIMLTILSIGSETGEEGNIIPESGKSSFHAVLRFPVA